MNLLIHSQQETKRNDGSPFPMMAKPTRVKRRYTLMRQEVVQAARQLIREKGIDGLSMRAIAKLVHTSPANLYEYFLNKEEIIISVYNDFLAGLLETLQGVSRDKSGRVYLHALCMQYIDYVGADSSQLQIASYPTQLETSELLQPDMEPVPFRATAATIKSGSQASNHLPIQSPLSTVQAPHHRDGHVDPVTAAYIKNTRQIFELFRQAVEKCIHEKTISSPTLNAQEITHVTWAFVHGLVTLSIQDVSILNRSTMQTAIVNFLDGLSSSPLR